MRNFSLDGPCMCGATDCPSCGPAQGYPRYDADAVEDSIQSEILRKQQSHSEILDAFEALSQDDFAEAARLILDAYDSTLTSGEIPREKLAAVGQHFTTTILRIFDEQTRREFEP